MDVAKLQVIIETKGVEVAQRELDKLAKQSSKTESATASLTKSFGVLNVALGAMAVGKLTTEFFKTADAMKLIEARVNLVSTATEKYSNIQKELVSIANENRTSFSATAQLYSKMKPDLDRVGVSTATVMKITDAFGKSLLIGGASAEEAASATLQFSQAMASGRLQGDEYRAMIETNPRLMRLLREELGKTSSEIKQMATDGKLTADVIGGVLVRGMEKLQKEVKTIPDTIGSSFQVFKNELALTVEQLDKTTGASELVIKATKSLTESVKEAPQYFERLNKSMDDVEKRYPNIIKTLNAAGFVVGKLVDGAAAAGDGIAWVTKGAMSTLAYSVDGVLSIAVDEYDRVIAQDKAYKEQAGKPLNISIRSGQEDYEAHLKEKQEKAQKEKLEKDKRAAKDMADIETDLDLYIMAIRGQADREKEEKAKKVKEAQEKAIKDSERLEKEWASKKIDIDKSVAIATQDELAKPYVELQYKYEEDLAKYGSIAGAKAKITKQFNLELERLNKETAQKVDEENEKALEKEQKAQEKLKRAKEQSIQKELKLQEENFRIQARQVELLDDEADKQVALATLEYQRTQASLSAQVKLGEVSQEYYDQMMDAETKLLEKQKQDWTMYGQIINNTTGAMESSFTNFFDGTSDDFMKFGDLAKNILKEIYLEAVRVALVRPLVSAGVGGAMSLFGGFSTSSSSTSLPNASTSTAFTGSEPLMFAKGGSFSSPSLSQYSGQIVDKPTFFAFANGGAPNMGLMGEAGSEAILPLSRNSSGVLGVQASGTANNVIINITNESGVPFKLEQKSKDKDDKGTEIRTYVMKFAVTDPEFRAALGISK